MSALPVSAEREAPGVSPPFQREGPAAQVGPLVADMTEWGAVELGPELAGQLVVRVGVQPAAHGPPLRGDVPVPAVLVGEDHLDQVPAELAEQRDQARQVVE